MNSNRFQNKGYNYFNIIKGYNYFDVIEGYDDFILLRDIIILILF